MTPTDALAERAVAAPAQAAQAPALPDYSAMSHHQLTALGARWDELGDAERRALLQEVKMRMARQKDSERVLQIHTSRRYGRIVRRSDGKVLRIETKVVQVRPVNPGRPGAERSFGVGFERRSADSAAQTQPRTESGQGASSPEDVRQIPGLRVSDPSR